MDKKGLLRMHYIMLTFLKFFHLIPSNDLVFKKMLICMYTKAFLVTSFSTRFL